jgi:hypothetical protein
MIPAFLRSPNNLRTSTGLFPTLDARKSLVNLRLSGNIAIISKIWTADEHFILIRIYFTSEQFNSGNEQ